MKDLIFRLRDRIMKHEEHGTINKKKKFGNGWYGSFTLYVNGDFRIGFRLSGKIVVLELFFFSIGLCNEFSGKRISKNSDFIDKNKNIGNGWITYFNLYLDRNFRLGFQLKKSQLSITLIFFSVGIWNLYSNKGFKLK